MPYSLKHEPAAERAAPDLPSEMSYGEFSMAKMTIIPGPCNLVTHIEATQTQPFVAQLNIESKCEAVQKLAAQLDTLTMQDVLTKGFGKGPVYEKAATTLVHNSCPVASGILKTAEVAMKLALPSPAKMSFEE
jgi:hypothetical protein